MKTEKVKSIWERLQTAIDGTGTIEVLKPSEIFICGPNSHNKIPGAYKTSRTGKVCGFYEEAVRENRRGWIPRLRAELGKLGLAEAKVKVKYDPLSCWTKGVGPTGQIRIDHPSFHDGWFPTFICLCLPIAAVKAAGTQRTLPVGWVAEPTWWEEKN